MKLICLPLLLVPLLSLAAGPGSNAIAEGYDLSPGKSFPDIVLPSVENGEALSLSEFRGEKVMLHLFASW